VIWVWIGIAVVVVAAGALVPVLMGRHSHRLRSNDEAVAARSRYHMLGHYVEDLDQVDHEQAAALLRTARERWHTTGSTLARARTEEDFLLAERIAGEGLVAVAEAYALLGRPGPRLPKK
jgi:hypothetical protein